MSYLYAAYLITWVVIIGYVLTMFVGFKKVSSEMRDLEREKAVGHGLHG